MSVSWRTRVVILVVVAFVQFACGGYWPVVFGLYSMAVAPFKPHMTEYLAPTNGLLGQGPVKGKMIVLDRKAGVVDWDVFFALPDSLRAGKPEEVGTAVLLDYGREEGDFVYGNERLPSYVQTCKVTVVDHASRTVIGQTMVTGGPPPSSIDEHAKEGVGSKPTIEVVNYLKGLPKG